MSGPRLVDLGERRLIEEVLAPRYAAQGGFGDDCAPVGALSPGGHLVATTDPCPPPMAHTLGFEDEYYRGWLLATINLSDLAAAAARPLGLLTSLQLPSETPLADFERLLDGVDECCAAHDTHVMGGNLKEVKHLDVSATAFGEVSGPPLGRSTARPGHVAALIGRPGLFWAGTLSRQRGLIAKDPGEPLLASALVPRAQTRVMQAAHREGLIAASMDVSDGLWPTLQGVAKASGCAVHVDVDGVELDREVTEAARQLGFEPFRLATGWGDWTMLVAIDQQDLKRLGELAGEHGTSVVALGHFVEADRAEVGGVLATHAGRSGRLLALDSERFTTGSWFGAGIDRYIDLLLGQPLLS